GFRTIALTPGEGSVPLRDAVTGASSDPSGASSDVERRLAFLVGAEGPGLKEHTMRSCDVRAHIPMSRGTDSLNVATAAAVAFYEALSR
ncbi:MAG: RNA methyltransferase, partial [Gordonia sp. (in: high G+C Gram-positive bacteria)]|nr:RNA methyltransferase [Gordonia sp. (in: high G+C Gram-positive bacteria)]